MPVRGGAEVAARARALVGTKFRPQGRQPDQGLDCIGLVVLAAGIPDALVPRRYSARSAISVPPELREMARPVPPEDAAAGDALIVRTGPGQHHMLILVPDGFVHADFRLGRVAEVPGAVPWPVISAWRFIEQER